MELEDILKDLDEWLFVVSPQLLVLELEYFSLLASKTWVHKQLLVSIDPPIHPQRMALFWHSHCYCFHPQTRPKFPELVKSSPSKTFLRINQIHDEFLKSIILDVKYQKIWNTQHVFRVYIQIFYVAYCGLDINGKMLVVQFHILHPKLLTLEVRLLSYKGKKKLFDRFCRWIFGQLELTNSTCIAGGNFDTSLCPPLLLLRLLWIK